MQGKEAGFSVIAPVQYVMDLVRCEEIVLKWRCERMYSRVQIVGQYIAEKTRI